ncbi:pseudouridylate synthase [Chitinimonas arctica]|uniref:tRNA pseudouridine synthase C n=1 Tax=Chitinimonas arctica TaxID=2594795 RepID=A0A516SH35_9NEIS|nr:pseudouridine synthase [Chitinimonas arctica]QDQ27442.1 pseudouridylate synthase [Chitinimonas arctica]
MHPILFLDDHLVAIHKPTALLVHRSEIDRHETRFALQEVRDQLGQRVHAIHRLDKGTSGILLFGLDADSARAVSRQFEAGTVDKRYLAIVRGWPAGEGLIDHPLSRQYDDYERSPDSIAPAQEAQTRFTRLATVELPHTVDRYPSSRYALLALEPLTGRKHQLRRHLKHLSHPIIGDATYGKGRHNRLFAEHYGSQRLLLACTRLAFDHPVSGARIVIESPLADEFAGLCERLGWAVPT